MTKAVVTALIAVVLGLTASPADARPMKSHGERTELRVPCARIQIVAGEANDCTAAFCKPRKHKHRHDKAVVVRKHKHHRHCLPPFSLAPLR